MGLTDLESKYQFKGTSQMHVWDGWGSGMGIDCGDSNNGWTVIILIEYVWGGWNISEGAKARNI